MREIITMQLESLLASTGVNTLSVLPSQSKSTPPSLLLNTTELQLHNTAMLPAFEETTNLFDSYLPGNESFLELSPSQALINKTDIELLTPQVSRARQRYGLDSSPEAIEHDFNQLSKALPSFLENFNKRNGTNIQPEHFMQFTYLETAGTFSPAVVNRIGATGFIQLTPLVMRELNRVYGTQYSTASVAAMSVEEQLNGPINHYFQMVTDRAKARNGGISPKLDSVGELYLAVAAPAGVGRQKNAVVYPAGSAAANGNPLWQNASGAVTVGSIAQAVERKATELQKLKTNEGELLSFVQRK